MKTDDIYFAGLALSTNVKYIGDLEDYFFGPGIIKRTSYTGLRCVLVKINNNICGEAVAKDLNTGRKYSCELPCETGKLFIAKEPLVPFVAAYPNVKTNLSKRKVLKLGNKFIREIYNTEKEYKKENGN